MSKRPTYLRINNAAEDVPRRIQGSGKTPDGGDWGLVILPHEQRSMLMVAGKAKRGDEPVVRTWDSATADSPDGRVDVLGALVEDGDADESVKALRRRGNMAVGNRTDITLRGKWKGVLRWESDRPVVELRREVGSYVDLVIRSHTTEAGHPAWRWEIHREERWFSKATADFGEMLTFKGAVEVALRQMEGVVGEACSVRDTRRRGALQSDYAGRVGQVREEKVTGRGVDRFKARRARSSTTGTESAQSSKSKGRTDRPVSRTPSPEVTLAPGNGKPPMLDATELRKRTDKFLKAWSAGRNVKNAKSWVRSAWHHMGLGKVELIGAASGSHIKVTITNLPKDLDAETRARMLVIVEAMPDGMILGSPHIDAEASDSTWG
jgi:hypothetical protein